MSLVNVIKEKQKASRISRNVVETSIYTTLLGEVLAVGKNKGNRETTDIEAIAIIKKFIKNLIDTNKAIIEHEGCTLQEKYVNNINEVTLLESLLPKQLTEEDLKRILLKDTCVEFKLPDFMRHLKENYIGLYDGVLASRVFKSTTSE